MRVLGIETSCDETAAAVVDDGRTVRSSVVSSQIDLHARYGGVVPELAGRAHVELFTQVVAEALAAAGPSSGDGVGRDGAGGDGAGGDGAGGDGGDGDGGSSSRAPVDAVAATCGPGLIGSLLVGVSGAKGLAKGWGVPF